MYVLLVANPKIQKLVNYYVSIRDDIKNKLGLLKQEPRKANGAHQLHGKLAGKWSCWLGSKIRLMYVIDDDKKVLRILSIGSHKIY